MKYYSTNKQAPEATLEEAVVKGLAADKGLFMPFTIKTLPQEFYDSIDTLSFQEIAYRVADAEAGHEGNVPLKIMTIENLDSRAVGPIYEAVKDWEEPVAISVLPDHPTPCELRTHTAEPIPFLIWHPGIEADEVRTFDEVAACEGSYGLMKEDEFINEFMSSTTE